MEFNSLNGTDSFNREMLKSERACRGWTQEDLAAKAGVSVQTVKLLESETHDESHEPRVNTVKKLAVAMDLHWGSFFGLKV